MITDDRTVRFLLLPSTVARLPTWAGACGFCPKIAMDFPLREKAMEILRNPMHSLKSSPPLVLATTRAKYLCAGAVLQILRYPFCPSL